MRDKAQENRDFFRLPFHLQWQLAQSLGLIRANEPTDARLWFARARSRSFARTLEEFKVMNDWGVARATAQTIVSDCVRLRRKVTRAQIAHSKVNSWYVVPRDPRD